MSRRNSRTSSTVHAPSSNTAPVTVESHDQFVQPLEAVPDRGVKDGDVKGDLIIRRRCGSVLSVNELIIHRHGLKVLYVRWVVAYKG